MACTGPSQKYAYKQADEYTEKVLADLKEKYRIQEPNGPLRNMLKDDYDKAVEQLRSAIRELFWIEACDTF